MYVIWSSHLLKSEKPTTIETIFENRIGFKENYKGLWEYYITLKCKFNINNYSIYSNYSSKLHTSDDNS